MEIIKRIRTTRGNTLAQVSEGTGLSMGLLSELERGFAENLKFSTVEKLANYFYEYKDEIHKEARRLPRDIFYKIIDSKLSFDEIRTILNQAGI